MITVIIKVNDLLAFVAMFSSFIPWFHCTLLCGKDNKVGDKYIV